MTMLNQNNRNVITSAGGTSFTYTFQLLSENEIKVIVTDSDGQNPVTKTLGVDYTVSGVGNANGGSVTFTSAVTAGKKVILDLNTALIQSTDLTTGDGFPAETFEAALDRLTSEILVVKRLINRALQLPENTPNNSDGVIIPDHSIVANQGKLLRLTAGGIDAVTVAAGVYAITDPLVATGSTASRFLADRAADVVNVKDFGAVGDNATDNATALTNAYNACPSGGTIYVPAGIYRYASALTFGTKTVAWVGEGSRSTIFRYSGANTTNDCFTVGDGVSPVAGWALHGIGFDSNTVMTGGNGVRLKAVVRSLGGITDTYFGHQDGNANFYHGVYFDQCDAVSLVGFQCRASQDGLRLRGHTLGAAGLHLYQFKIQGCTVGIRCGGGFGGLWIDQGDVIANSKNLLLDETLQATANREIFLGPSLALDTGGSVGVYNGTNFEVGGTGGVIFCNGTWNASAGTLVKISSSFAGQIYFIGGYLYNALTADGGNGRAIDNASTGASIYVSSTVFANCVGAGIYTSVSNTHLYLNNPIFKSDVTAPVHASFTTADQRTSFTPALSFGGGSTGMTYSSQLGVWCREGNRVFGQVYIKLTAKGSSTGSATISLSGLPGILGSNANLGNSGRGSYVLNMASLNGPVTGLVGSGPVLNLYHTGATGISSLTDGHFTNTSEIGIGFDYFVA